MDLIRVSISIVVAGASLAGCGTVLQVGGAPEKARQNCAAQAARRLAVPPSSVVVSSSSLTRDGIYAVQLATADGRSRLVCTVDENGAVLEMAAPR